MRQSYLRCRHFSFQQCGPLFSGFLGNEDNTCSP